MMQRIGRMKGVFHPAVSLITRENVARRILPEPKCYFWQGWGSWAGAGVRGSRGRASQPHRRRHTVLTGSWQGLLRATVSSLLPKGSCGWHGGSRKQRLKSPAWGFSDSDQQRREGNNCCCLHIAPGSLRRSVSLCHTHALEKHSAFLGPREHLHSLHAGQFPVIQGPLLSGQGTAAHHHHTEALEETQFLTFLN